jgi:predicted 3-demethylubiquinone-9 3-methyltransferase (glyoxalase superfamily)
MTVAFELDGLPFLALNGGPAFRFTEAVSFVARCRDQAEIDRTWSLLSAGGEESRCGWLKDRFGLSWQVVPERLEELLSGEGADRVMAAILTMRKLDLAALERARRGG